MSTQWLNIGEDAGALHALLERIPSHAPVTGIDYLWIFPARKIAIGESVVIVIAGFDEDPARRRVSTAHFTIARNKKGLATVNARYAEHGSAPESAVSRIVEGVLRRLGEDTEAAPREEKIEGSQEAWNALVVDLGGRIADPPADEAPAEPEAGADAGSRPAEASGDGMSGVLPQQDAASTDS